MNAPAPVLAGFWTRAAACAIDGGILWVVNRAFEPYLPGEFGIYLGYLAQSLFSMAYYVLMWGEMGTSLGGMVMGIRGVRMDGSPMGYKTALIRHLSTFVSAIVVGLGYLWAFWDPQKQTWHDKIAGTLVVKKIKGEIQDDPV